MVQSSPSSRFTHTSIKVRITFIDFFTYPLLGPKIKKNKKKKKKKLEGAQTEAIENAEPKPAEEKKDD